MVGGEWQPHRVNSYDCVTICYICKCAREVEAMLGEAALKGLFSQYKF